MQTVTEIQIDFSTSMKDKLPLTKSALINDIIPNLDYSARIGIKTFSATYDKKPIIKTILPLSLTNKAQIITAVNSLSEPDGNTPIAAAIKNSVESLKEYLAFDKKIILITDGEENCDGHYPTEVNAAKTNGINCQIHIIGIGLTSEASTQAINISTSSKGSFSQIAFAAGTVYNQPTVNKSLAPFFTAVKQPPYQQPSVLTKVNKSEPTIVIQLESQPKPVTQPTPQSQPQPQPISTPTPQSQLQSKSPTVSEPAKQKAVINEPIDQAISNVEAFKLIISEIKEIKNQIKELNEKNEEMLEIAENEELNEKIRKASEEYLFDILKRKYQNRVKWLNEKGESYSDHDFEILELDGSVEYYIECKGTPKNKPTFYMTKDEWRLFLNHTKNYQLYFIRNSFENPTPIFVDNLLDWVLKGKIVPYLKVKQTIKEDRVFLTFDDV